MSGTLKRDVNHRQQSLLQTICNKFLFFFESALFKSPKKKLEFLNLSRNLDTDSESELDYDTKIFRKKPGKPSGKIINTSKRTYIMDTKYIEDPNKNVIDITIPEDFTIINDDTGKIILARDNHSIPEDENLNRQILELEQRLIERGIPRHFNFRNMAVLIKQKDDNPNIIKLYFLDNDDEYKRIIEQLLQSEVLSQHDLTLIQNYKIDIIQKLLMQAKRMNIELQYPFLAFSNVPFNYEGRIASYHQDKIVTTLTNERFSAALYDIFESPEVNYSFFKYKNNCVSTTISFNYKGKKIVIRFMACPNTTVAIDNIYTTHSKPYHCNISDIDIYPKVNREIGNEQLAPINTERSLNRIGIKFINPEEYAKIIELLTRTSGFIGIVELDEISLQPVETHQNLSVGQFLTAPGIDEVVVGGRKKRTKRRRTKRRRTKRKIIRK